ncbi:MAG: UDP-N-acetylglucosamine 1-carboxyvinyltransferase [Candidatus Gastranaerophilales bacterium]|nr:UDP-N-acetylglucosamine 1-carboxyvinyltransferase [Candidatus Gastranaerophilales bacterium]
MKEKVIINGAKKLYGEVKIGGAKNAVLKHMAAALLLKDSCLIHNVPRLTDVETMIDLLASLGAKIEYDLNNNSILIDSANLSNNVANYEHVSKMRASFNVLGALIGRCKEAKVALPGGCAIGERKVNLHIKGLEALGAKIKIENGYVLASANKLTGADVYLDIPSVGATENIMLASVLAEGSTRIQNAAQEPEIADLANFLNSMGADIIGAGTSEIIINGVSHKDLHPCSYSTIPDRIEAGTYMAAIVATRGHGIIKNVFPTQLTAVTSKLTEMGANVNILDPFSLEISCNSTPKAVNIVTQPYPGFPTDLQSPLMSVLTTAKGVSIITESLYENRFMQVAELRRMGADVQQDGTHAIINGVKKLTGAQVKASDLRAGASLLVAALSANGTTSVSSLHHIDRGYEIFEKKLKDLGASIERVIDDSLPVSKPVNTINLEV